jgi:hypothetical protein
MTRSTAPESTLVTSGISDSATGIIGIIGIIGAPQ